MTAATPVRSNASRAPSALLRPPVRITGAGSDRASSAASSYVGVPLWCTSAERGWIDGNAVALEHLTAIRRAGADIILTYFARTAAETLLAR